MSRIGEIKHLLEPIIVQFIPNDTEYEICNNEDSTDREYNIVDGDIFN